MTTESGEAMSAQTEAEAAKTMLRALLASRDSLQAECAQLRKDAERYRWLRMRDWFTDALCVLRYPKQVLTRGPGLGADCPSRERLDAAIDAAISQGDSVTVGKP